MRATSAPPPQREACPQISGIQAPCFAVTGGGTLLAISQGFSAIAGSSSQTLIGQEVYVLSSLFGFSDWAEKLDRVQENGYARWGIWVQTQNDLHKPYNLIASQMELPGHNRNGYFFYCAPQGSLGPEKHELLESALQDPLTGLFNRRYLETSVQEAIETSKRTGLRMGILVVDVDEFKPINDSFGHSVGDEVLIHIAKAITDAVPLGDTVIRYGGDEFIVVIHDLLDDQHLEKISEEIQFEVAKPFFAEDKPLRVQLSIGSSLFPEQGETLTELVKHADAEMYQSKETKKRGRARPQAHPNGQTSWPKQAQSWSARFRRCLKEKQFIQYYQPLVDFKSQQAIGAEALTRWQRSATDLRLPSEFIPMAENHGVVSELDRAAFRDVCKQAAQARSRLEQGFCFYVNLSACSLNEDGMYDFLTATIASFGLRPENFCIELTESVTLLETDPGRECLFQLSRQGFSIVLDDFGAGYSSLSLLKALPVSGIKIDKSFVANITRSSRDRKIVESLLSLCKSLETCSIVEGIETGEQADILTDLGADIGQGYYFGRPAPFGEALPRV